MRLKIDRSVMLESGFSVLIQYPGWQRLVLEFSNGGRNQKHLQKI